MQCIFEGHYASKHKKQHMATLEKVARYADVEELQDDIVEVVMCRFCEEQQKVYCVTENKVIVEIPYAEYCVQGKVHIKEYLGRKLCVRLVDKCITENALGEQVDGYVASRKVLQEEYIKNVLSTYKVRDTVFDVCVVTIVGDGVFVDCGYGLTAYLCLHTLTVSRVGLYSTLCAVGSILPVVMVEPMRADYTITISHRELLGSWEDNANLFAENERTVGVVLSVQAYGVFIALNANLVGLAEYTEGVQAGQVVNVNILRIDHYKQKVKLEIVGLLPATERANLLHKTKTFVAQYLNNVNTYGYWQYGNVQKQNKDTLFCFTQREVEFPPVYINTIEGVHEVERKYYGFVCTNVPEK